MNLCWKHLFFLTEIQKVLLKLRKEKGCEIVGRWQKACVRHFYWSITSTEEKEGSENLKLAKVQAFLYHVITKHKDLPTTVLCKSNASKFRRISWLLMAFQRSFASNEISATFPQTFKSSIVLFLPNFQRIIRGGH